MGVSSWQTLAQPGDRLGSTVAVLFPVAPHSRVELSEKEDFLLKLLPGLPLDFHLPCESISTAQAISK